MRSFIIVHADAVVATTSVMLILLEINSVMEELRVLSSNASGLNYPGSRHLAAFYALVTLILLGITIFFASTYASPRANRLFWLALLSGPLSTAITKNLNAKIAKGYVYAGMCIALLAVAAILTAFAPAPK